MGTGTPVTNSQEFWRRNVTQITRRPLRLGIDVPLLLIVAILLVFGLLMVYSASTDYSFVILGEAPAYMFRRQLVFALLGIGLATIATFIDYRRWQKLALPAILVTLVSLIAVLLIGQVVNNAARTLFGASIQPSEAAKLVTVIYLSVWLFAKRDDLSQIGFGVVPLGFIIGILGGLILLQPDLSAAATIFLLGSLMFFLAGGDLRQFALLFLGGLASGWIVFSLHPTGKQRLAEYLVSRQDITQAPMHLSRSLEAIVKGGWFGVGIGQADSKLTGLPVPPTDSIFAVIGEETGLIGAAVVVILFILLMWRGLVIAQKAPDGLGKLMAAGLCLWIAIEAFINMAVIVGLVPFAGNALPFISAGGSNLVVSLVAIGILMNISRMSVKTIAEKERVTDAVVDLRRWDRRRRVPRARRAQSTHSQ